MAGRGGKRVRGVVEIGANYVFHLMAVARIGFESEYAEKYRDSVFPDDITFLRNYKDELTFGGGSSSELIGPIIAWPACFNLDSKEALREHIDLLDEAFRNDDYKPYLEKYDSHIRKTEKWWYTITEELLRMFVPQREIIRQLGDILVRNIDTYIDKVWVDESSRLNEVAAGMNRHFGNNDRIGQWEKLTGFKFEFEYYDIVLCSAIKNGSNANSLSYDRVVFYHGSPAEELMEFISHEIGTHIMIGMLKDVAKTGKFEFPFLYEGYELLARYYNTIILNRSPLSYNMSAFHVPEYLEIYANIYEAEPEISPRDLLEKGMADFQNSR